MIKNIKNALLRLIRALTSPLAAYVYRNARLFIRNAGKIKLATYKNFRRTNSRLLIFGNGPSLTESIESYKHLFDRFDCLVVNSFADTKYYQELKPGMYLLADPAYFQKRSGLEELTRTQITQMEKSLIDKTSWQLSLFVPVYARESELVMNVKSNSFISIYYYNPGDIFIPRSDKAKFWAWDHNYITFLAQTVLNTCVNLGIALRYKEIVLIGADTSWTQDLELDQEDNRLYIMDKHFYGNEKRYLYHLEKMKASKYDSALSIQFAAVSRVLSYYGVLKAYADSRNVKIYNSSGYSLIDVYDRKKLPEIVNADN